MEIWNGDDTPVQGESMTVVTILLKDVTNFVGNVASVSKDCASVAEIQG